MGGIRSFYYFQVHTKQDNGDDLEPKLVTRYFRSGHEVAAFIGCSRPTVFKLIREPEASIYSKNYIVEKCEPPLPMYEKVKVKSILVS
jgi:hypothetical protein